MKIQVLLFAHLKDAAGRRAVELELPAPATAAGLKRKLAEVCPALAPALAHALVAVNREFASDETPIAEGAEVALFPPVSGG